MRAGHRTALAASLSVVALTAVRSPASAVLYISESFMNSSAASGFVAGGGACLTAAGPAASNVPPCAAGGPGGNTGTLPDASGSGALRLTSNGQSQSGFIVYGVASPSSQGLEATFTEYAYDTTTAAGADGISFFFLDATQGAAPTTPGAFGGSLGYAQRTGPTTNGIGEGYVGIGLDEFGNYSNPTEGRSGGPGFIPETVGIRGKCGASPCTGGSVAGYAYLTGYRSGGSAASLPFMIDTPSAKTRPAVAFRTWRVILTTALTVEVDVDLGSGFEQIVPPTNVSTINGTAFPSSFYFGFASSTGASTNIHEITTVSLQSATAQFSLANGPAGNPSAIGSYDGVVAVNNQDDFTERAFFPTTAGYSPVYGAAATYPAAVPGIRVPHQIANTGTVNDTYALSDTAPSGWTVELYPDASGGANVTSPSTTSLGATAPAATGTGTIAVAAGATATYWAVYTAPAGVPAFTRFDAPITATSQTISQVENTTHDELYSGFVATQKTATVTKSNCAFTTTGICPGGILQYAITYASIALAGGPNSTETGFTPAALLSTGPGSLDITEDGAAGTNTWATTTTGLRAAPTDSTNGSTFLYGASPGSASLTPGATRFVDRVGGATGTLGPQQTGTITFALTAK